MSDYLHLNVQPDDLRAMSSLALAHMGDAVYEILARGWLCTQGRATCGNLHKETVALVRAEAQAAAVEKLLPCLTEAERAVYRRGRNAQKRQPRPVHPCHRPGSAVRMALPTGTAGTHQPAVRYHHGRKGGVRICRWMPPA